MAIRDAENKIVEAWQEVNAQWHTTCQFWRDAEQQKFEATYWRDLEQETQAYSRALQALGETIRAAELILQN